MPSSDTVRVAEVVLDIPTRALDSTFTYLVPPGLDAQVGQCVQVEFSKRPSIGYIMDISERSLASFGDISLRPIQRVLSVPWFDEVSAQLARWIAREYLSTLPEAVRLFMPPGAAPKIRRAPDGSWELVPPAVAPVDDRWARLTDEGRSYQPRKGAAKQVAVIEALRAGEMRVAELGIEISNVSATLAALQKKGVVEVELRRRTRGLAPQLPRTEDIANLTQGQRDALQAIEQARGNGAGSVVVLDGVTGSGKTEVYLQAIRKVVESGGSAVVLVPEISLTPQTVGRFRSRFGDSVAVLHSRLSVGERYDQWSLVREGHARVVVGARSALFAPLRDLKLIVIDEEHEGTYKQSSSPRYTSRDVAVKIAQMRGAAVVLGSASPSIEALHRCQHGDWHRVELPQRASGRPLPPVQVVDLGREFAHGNHTMFSTALSQALVQAMDAGEKAVLLLNRRGFASFLLCRECGFVPTCQHCSTSMTYHETRGRGGQVTGGFLLCHHCGSQQPVPARCPECGSPYLRQLGPGTQFAADQLRQVVGPDVPIVRMDADTTRTKDAHEKLLGQFASADRGVLLGTQMIAKGLDFPDVTLAGVLIADTTLKLPDFRASERTFQLIEQVAGRAGRAEREGRVIVQTYWPQHPAIVAASRHDRQLFLSTELPLRREMGYPPYRRLANILLWGADDKQVSHEAMALRMALDQHFDRLQGKDTLFWAAGESDEDASGVPRELAAMAPAADVPDDAWEVLGPSPCLLSKLRGTFRWHILVKAPAGADIPGALHQVMQQRKPVDGVSVAVDVDPVDLF